MTFSPTIIRTMEKFGKVFELHQTTSKIIEQDFDHRTGWSNETNFLRTSMLNIVQWSIRHVWPGLLYLKKIWRCPKNLFCPLFEKYLNNCRHFFFQSSMILRINCLACEKVPIWILIYSFDQRVRGGKIFFVRPTNLFANRCLYLWQTLW